MLASNNLSSKDELKRVQCIQASNKKVGRDEVIAHLIT